MAQRVQEVAGDVIIDEKKILKEAKEREKEIKKEIAEAKKEDRAHKEQAVAKVTKVRVKKHGKKYRDSLSKIEKNKEYDIEEAIKIAKEGSNTTFDATLELHIKIDKKMENIRGTVNLSGGVAKKKKVLVVDEKNADQVVENVQKGKADFDIMITSPTVMPKLRQLAKILGPKGLMPNPKTGTIVEDTAKAKEEFEGGKAEYKADKGNVVHMSIGKVSFEDQKIKENYDIILSALPKGKILSIHLATTMGPSIRVAC